MSTPEDSSRAPRTIRFSAALRAVIDRDAVRCGRSFEQQVVALLRTHYGEDVDRAPAPGDVLALARASVAGMSAAEQRRVSGRPRRGR